MSFHKSEFVKARKEHQCFLCAGTISKGDTYQRVTGSDCGDFYFVKQHDECNRFVDDTTDDPYGVIMEHEALHTARNYAEQSKGESNHDFVKRCHGIHLAEAEERKAAKV